MQMEYSEDAQISKDPETHGFDLSAGRTWIYPENYPIRDYQFNIVQAALYYNTLVCLPTGLGKTFIAAVIMYNFWRWYPRGKVIFLAPTKPLVAQQIDACQNVMGIPSVECVELTGSVCQKKRQTIWLKKRIIFATPQVLHNDLEKKIICSELVKCIVVDEAHKALGKHSYCECIRILSAQNQYFRILALSATPGNKISNVHEVLRNLYISHIELRDETSSDVIPYINEKKVDIVLVPLSEELIKYKEKYIQIMDRHVRYLIQYNILQGQSANISKGKIFIILREFKKVSDKSANHRFIMKTLNILLTMYHAYELMIRHGLRAFHKFYQNHSDKFWITEEHQLLELLEDIQIYLGPFPDIQVTGKDIPEIPKNLVFGHNKFSKLKELIVRHFQSVQKNEGNTRAIVFVEYRDIVNEVYILLLQAQPLIRPQIFVGQAGQKQRHQKKAIEDFKNNRVNVLISTCIGEEGLDIGEVDLIICFDVSQKSPIRLVQRMGRTGRKRDGHIVVLVTDGKEHEILKSTIARRDSLNNKILNTNDIVTSLYRNNPRMIPNEFNPKCHKIHINVELKVPTKVARNKKKTEVLEENATIKCNKKLKSTKQTISTDESKNTNRTMFKFLTSSASDTQVNIDDKVGHQDFVTVKTDAIHNVIEPKNVKLLTCDNDIIEFLTLSTMKKSEKDMCSESIKKMDMTYVAVPAPISRFYDYNLPSVDIDKFISSLTRRETEILTENKNYSNDENNYDMDNDNDNDFWCSNRYNDLNFTDSNVRGFNNIEESRFEDLIDKSTDSDETMVSNNSTSYANVTKFAVTVTKSIGNSNEGTIIPTRNMVSSETKSDIRSGILHENISLLEDTSPGIFEDILNDSFESLVSEKCVDDLETAEVGSLQSCKITSEGVDDSSLRDKEESTRFSKMSKSPDEVRTEKEIINDGKRMPNAETRDTLSSVTNRNKIVDNRLVKTVRRDKDTLSITQAIEEIARITRKHSVSKEIVDVAENNGKTMAGDIERLDFSSEDDMFATESESEFNIGMMNKTLSAMAGVTNASSSSKEFEHIGDNEFENINCEWNISTSRTPQKDVKHFKSTSELLLGIRNLDIQNTNSEESIPKNKQKTGKQESLAKKILRKSSSSIRKQKYNELNNSEDDFAINSDDMNKLNELESSYFYKKDNSEVEDREASSSKLSLKKKKKEQTTAKNFNSFTASSKYLEEHWNDTDSDVDVSTSKHTKFKKKKIAKKKESIGSRKKRNLKSNFIIDEADDGYSDDTESEHSEMDADITNFVSYTQRVDDSVDMTAIYLRTTRSPVKKTSSFFVKKQRLSDPKIDVYSQDSSETEDTYIQDSFCVVEDDDNLNESNCFDEYSVLEEAENKINDRKRKCIVNNKSKSNVKKANKRKRIVNIFTSSSSDDETEKLRKQILEESIRLKNSKNIM